MKDDTSKPPDYSYKWFGWFIYFVLLNHKQSCYHEATWMSPCWAGVWGCTPRSTKDFCHFSSLKSEASLTQKSLNFSTKSWQCQLYWSPSFYWSEKWNYIDGCAHEASLLMPKQVWRALAELLIQNRMKIQKNPHRFIIFQWVEDLIASNSR